MKRLLAIVFCALLLCGVSVRQSSAQINQLGNVLTGKQKKGQDAKRQPI